ncbi:MAG: hybrid sensor histidine kinase/response regulator [Pseudomonadota bacterium]
MDLDPKVLQELMSTFQEELVELLQNITDGLLALEKQPSSQEQEKILHAIFRSAHNIKGSARSLNIETISKMAHKLEDLFSKLHEKNIKPTSDTIDIALSVLDEMRIAMDAFLNQKEYDNSAILAKLENLIEKPPEAKQGTVERKEEDRTEAKKTEAKEKIEFAEAEIETIKTNINISESVKVPVEKIESISAFVDELQASKLEAEDLYYANLPKIRSLLNEVDMTWKQLLLFCNKTSTDDFVKQISRFAETGLKFTNAANKYTNRIHQSLRANNNKLGFVANSLRSNIQVLRLIPASIILQPLMRSVRELAKLFNKEVELEIFGGEIEIDRAILVLIKDPIIHLLRNAVDHGIETREERIKLGKPPAGKITIRLVNEGGRVLLSITDDGSGIDLDRVIAVAKQKKILTDEEIAHRTNDELIDLIFISGFSTKKMITDISGRGVGLDVVRTNVQRAKGDISIDTKVNKGTTIILSLPLTLVTDNGLLIRTGNQIFVIPTMLVKRILQVDKTNINIIEGEDVIVLDNRPIALYDLGALLQLTKHASNGFPYLTVIILESKGKPAVGFIIDEVISEREIVIKSLLPPLDTIPNISGATLTGRGEVLLVLNHSDLINLATHMRKKSNLNPSNDHAKIASRILVVDDSLTTRTLLTNILMTQQFEVVSAINGKEAWDILQKEHFDLIVTDVLMPIMDGFELTKKIKNEDHLNTIPVVIVTSLANDSDRKKGVEAGADAYIVKSQFENKMLIDVIEQLLLT